MKAFVAVIPPLHIREKISKMQHVDKPIDKMHVTVHFIGNVTQAAMKILREKFITIEADQICSLLYGAGAFNNKDGSAYLRVGPHPEWFGLHEKVATTFGHKLHQTYTPHLTVRTFKGTNVPEQVVPDLTSNFGYRNGFLFNADKISLLTSKNGAYNIVNTVWLRKR